MAAIVVGSNEGNKMRIMMYLYTNEYLKVQSAAVGLTLVVDSSPAQHSYGYSTNESLHQHWSVGSFKLNIRLVADAKGSNYIPMMIEMTF
jgi:hypothetical protein